MKTKRLYRSLVVVFASILVVPVVQASMTIKEVVSNMPATEKTYQLIYVGDSKLVAPQMRNSAYVASFGSADGEKGEQLFTSMDIKLPFSKRFAIQGYPRFIQVKDDGSVIRWDFKDYPAYSENGESRKATAKDFEAFFDNYNTDLAKPLSVLNYLQPMHAISYADGKIVGQQTFLGKYILWDLSNPGKVSGHYGEIKDKENAQVNKSSFFNSAQEVRVRLAKFSADGKTIYSMVRAEEEDPSSEEFMGEVTSFPTSHLKSGQELQRTNIKDAASGHALFVTDKTLYTGGTDLRKVDIATGKVTIYKFLDKINFGIEKPAFLNIIADEANHKLYAVSSRDTDPDEVEAKNYDDYIRKFEKFSKDHKQGLYAFSIVNGNELKLDKYIPLMQPVELELDKKAHALFISDRIGRKIVAVNTETLDKIGEVTTQCHVSNITLNNKGRLYATSVYLTQLHLLPKSQHNCNAVYQVDYTF